ncbi:MAG: UDP-glucose/GDP-mannose dehydrogenase family protein [Corynebacterium sp.]|nr:UDP-glucose/GDP-mannose dehydrogenase family protein [Corynebacterium sp.]
MRITVIGCGYLGVVHAVCLTTLGHEVVGIDTDTAKIARLSAGECTFFEPGLPELLAEALESGRLRFVGAATPAATAVLAAAEVHFITVGTPQVADGLAADVSFVTAAVDAVIATAGAEPPVVVGKSTVPVGTAEQLGSRLAAHGIALVWNPEFLREGFAVADTLRPDRIVYGLPADEELARRGRAVLDEVYAPALAAGVPLVVSNYATAELVKVAANSFLATKISFINSMAELCERTGGDVVQLAEALGYDARIGSQFLRAGVGFGGGCLTKDIRAFIARATELGVESSVSFLRQVDAINQHSRDRVVDQALQLLGDEPQGKKVTVLGASFKPNSDDIRDSPALEVADRLHGQGVDVTVTDPQALFGVHRSFPHLRTESDINAALSGAELVLLLTEWQEFSHLDPQATIDLVEQPQLIDGRNALNPRAWRAAGWRYTGMGR